MECPKCGRPMNRNGKRSDRQRWHCPYCPANITENPGKAGNPNFKSLIGRPLTEAEKKRWQRKGELPKPPGEGEEGIIEEEQEQQAWGNELADGSEAESEG